jgi:ATP-binding cassette subfamily C protein
MLKANNIHKKYGQLEVLKGVDVEINQGEVVSIVGASGAGKSTIADLLCLLITPSSGQILRTHQKGDSSVHVRSRVSYVPQRPGMVSGTILENVALGVPIEEVNRQEVLDALRTAHLGALIDEIPLGIDAPLGKLKDNLSGGQMQRIGLARALYFRPSLLVMDEATSALDAESEAEIAKILDQMRGQVTVVLIAHRLNTVQHADRVFLVEEGKLIDQGTFQELLSRNPSIGRLVQLMKIDED